MGQGGALGKWRVWGVRGGGVGGGGSVVSVQRSGREELSQVAIDYSRYCQHMGTVEPGRHG